MKKISLYFLFAALSMNVLAQDTLYKRNQEILIVKISEIGLDEVKYKLWGYESGPTISVAKDNLLKVVFANGVTQYFSSDLENPENYAAQRKNAVKIDFISPLRNNLSLIYERSLKPGRSIEANIGVIGVGIGTGDWDNSSGAFFRVGYKFIKSPDYYMRGMRYAHILKGGYVRPDVIFGSYSTDQTIDNSYWNPNPPYNYISLLSSQKEKITFGALQITLGKQWIYDDVFLIDIFAGLGYCLSESDLPDASATVNYAVLGGGSDTPLSTSAGFRVGLLLK